jgi:TolB-like protein/Tfp pilus assembly protein PilF
VEGKTKAMSFFKELKRRNVFKVGVAYTVACWLSLQIVDLVLENINAPDWIMQVFMLGLAVGFPIAIIVAWAFELTPNGVKLHKNVDPGRSLSRHTGHQLNRGIIVILSMAIVLLLTDRYRDELFDAQEPAGAKTEASDAQANVPETEKSRTSIAVLPFRDMSAAQDQAYFGEGISEELLNALVKIDGLDVASRTSSFSLSTENLDVPAIAARLGVNHILEGSVRTSGQKVRVTAQLIDVGKDVHLWSETYDGSLDDIFKIQDEITGKITAELKLQLGGGGMSPSAEQLTNNAAAYQLYLEGRHLWRQRNAASLNEAIRLFKQAVQLDPKFHRAWSNLAIAYTNLPDYDRSASFDDSIELGLAAAQKALEIEPQSSEALIITANYNEFHCNYSEAARQFQRAIELNPQDPTAQHWYGIMLSEAGHTTKALEHIQTAHRIDPMISAVLGIESRLYRNMGDYAQAHVLDREAAALGLYGGSLHRTGIDYLYAGALDQGREILEKGWTDESPAAAVNRKQFLLALDNPEQQKLFESQLGKADASDPAITTYDTVEYFAILGSPYLFDYLSEVECPYLGDSIWSEPFREQRGTPEFFELMQRAGIVEYWREYGWPDDCASLDQTLAECK